MLVGGVVEHAFDKNVGSQDKDLMFGGVMGHAVDKNVGVGGVVNAEVFDVKDERSYVGQVASGAVQIYGKGHGHGHEHVQRALETGNVRAYVFRHPHR